MASQLRTYANVFKSTEHITIKSQTQPTSSFSESSFTTNSSTQCSMMQTWPGAPLSFRQTFAKYCSIRERTGILFGVCPIYIIKLVNRFGQLCLHLPFYSPVFPLKMQLLKPPSFAGIHISLLPYIKFGLPSPLRHLSALVVSDEHAQVSCHHHFPLHSV